MSEWSLTRTAFWKELPETDRLLISHPRKEKRLRTSQGSDHTNECYISKETEISMENFSCRKIRVIVYCYLMKRNHSPSPKLCAPVLAHVIFIMTWGCGLWVQAVKTSSRIFWLAEKPMWPCIAVHVWVMEASLDLLVTPGQCCLPPCLYNLRGPAYSGPFIFLQERNVSLKIRMKAKIHLNKHEEIKYFKLYFVITQRYF